MKIGIDLGGSHIAVGAISESGNILSKKEDNIQFNGEEQDKIKQIIRDRILSLINHVKNVLQMPIFIIEEIGIGVPGIVENNVIVKCEKYGIYNWDLAKELEDFYKVDVKITNDALCAAKCEKKYGSLKNFKKSIFMCLGTGIGGATIIDDEIFPSEFGHMVIERESGIECQCGRLGCFEKYASMNVFRNGMIQILNLDENTTSEELLYILKEDRNNEIVNNYIDEYLDTLVLGISNIINIINPEVICLGGSFTYFEEILYFKLVNKIKACNYQFKVPKIVLAEYKNDAGIIGSVI